MDKDGEGVGVREGRWDARFAGPERVKELAPVMTGRVRGFWTKTLTRESSSLLGKSSASQIRRDSASCEYVRTLSTL